MRSNWAPTARAAYECNSTACNGSLQWGVSLTPDCRQSSIVARLRQQQCPRQAIMWMHVNQALHCLGQVIAWHCAACVDGQDSQALLLP